MRRASLAVGRVSMTVAERTSARRGQSSAPPVPRIRIFQRVEIRASPHLRTLKGGSIIFGVASNVDCVVRNLSETRACLEAARFPTTSFFK
jgi:hypothetical protein